jgi:hypothetical protein
MPERRTKMNSATLRAFLAKALVVPSSILAAQFLGAGTAAGTTIDVSCVPIQVAVFTNAPRLHVRCAASVGGIIYFALSTADSPLAARVLSILTTAQVAGRTLGIRYDPADTSGTSIGCQANDCRLIDEVWFGQ